ncbi:hypothetical protein CsatA_003190 [Cannabis sativa]
MEGNISKKVLSREVDYEIEPGMLNAMEENPLSDVLKRYTRMDFLLSYYKFLEFHL